MGIIVYELSLAIWTQLIEEEESRALQESRASADLVKITWSMNARALV